MDEEKRFKHKLSFRFIKKRSIMKCSFKRELLTNKWDPIGSPIQMLGIINILQIALIMQ